MRALVLHPEDSLFDSHWSGTHWDFVFDLGTAGANIYSEWENRLGGHVAGLIAFRSSDDAARLRDLLSFARSKIVDDLGLDWWELNCVFFYQAFDQAMLLLRLADELRHCDEVVVSRPGFPARVLQLLLGERVCVSQPAPWSQAGARLKHYGRLLSKFSPSQLAEICSDKFDPEYSLRRRFPQKASQLKQPVVLFPSAYSNASKMLAAYARMLPDQQFLLVATRRSATLFQPPSNVHLVSLAAYSHARRSPARLSSLLKKWNHVLTTTEYVPEWNQLHRAGALDSFPRLLSTGMAIRDAWLNVFQQHDVSAVFSGDEGNPYVCIPLKLAAGRGIPSLSVHHGALDGRFALKEPSAELILAKSTMELDYLMRCGLEPCRLVLGAPAVRSATSTAAPSGSDIIFFSEPYEVFSGRTEEIYRQLLPPLCKLAVTAGRKILLKLHPFESAHDRGRWIRRVLCPAERDSVQIVNGPLTPALFDRAWFGITVQSTVAIECAIAAIPCFLCDWLSDPLFGYARHFSKFGAGYLLKSPDDIATIPQILEKYTPSSAIAENLCSSLSCDALRTLLRGRTVPAAAAVC